MKLRLYAAIVTGILAAQNVMAGLWCYTDKEVISIIFWGIAVYVVTLYIVLAIAEPRKRRHTEPQLFDLKEKSPEPTKAIRA